MRVLLVGGGGREHALAWKLVQSPRLGRLYAAPGNPGIAAVAECVAIRADAVIELADFAARAGIDLVVVGPEGPLALGLADLVAARGIPVFGPTGKAAALESSKVFAKTLFARHGIPTARFGAFDEAEGARAFARELGGRVVVKADGLAAGKGAIVCDDLAGAERAVGDLLERRVLGDAGARVVVEERLVGEEVSVFALTDGERVCLLAAAQDHKAVFDGDRGPNTGGMGAYSPAPIVDTGLATRIVDTILVPTVRAMAEAGRPYRGVLYAGLMLTEAGPQVIEYNVRFGDPECQVLMPRLDEDLLPLVQAVAEGHALPTSVAWRSDAAVCVVLASGGYPGSYATGLAIDGLEAAATCPGVTVFHAGTAARNGRLVTAGGRVLGVTAIGPDVPAAVAAAYEAAGRIRFDGMHYRRDIGARALRRLGHAAERPREETVNEDGGGVRIMVVDPERPVVADLQTAAGVLRDGGLVAFPTETFYGLGANALDPDAVGRVFRAKGRPASLPLLVLVDSTRMVRTVAADVPERAERLMARHWPGPLTLVLPARPGLPTALTAGTGTIGVRLSGHPLARALVRMAGLPVTAPSANPHGAASPVTAGEVKTSLGGTVDLIVDGGPTAGGAPSTVLDLTGPRPRVVRAGAVVLGPEDLDGP